MARVFRQKVLQIGQRVSERMDDLTARPVYGAPPPRQYQSRRPVAPPPQRQKARRRFSWFGK